MAKYEDLSLNERMLLKFEAEEFLFCPDSRLKYRIDDGIPVMLIEEAERLGEAEGRQLAERHSSAGAR